jgi:ribose/xylose/arabinose/galactoside ABC-type transport system permease subunit
MVFPVGALAGLYGARILGARYGKASPVTRSGAALLALLASVIFGSLLYPLVGKGGGLAAALPAALLVGVSCGLTNGLVTALGRVPPFVVTLGMLTAARGLTVYATDGNSVSGLPPGLSVLGEGSAVVLLALALVMGGMVLQTKTAPGRYIEAIGANEEASRLTGVHVPL